jgi:hypothetical protein
MNSNRSFHLDYPQSCVLHTVLSVLQIYWGKPVRSLQTTYEITSGRGTVNRSILMHGRFQVHEETRTLRIVTCHGTIRVATFLPDHWEPVAEEQGLVIQNELVTFSRMSPAESLLQTFRLKTFKGNLVIGSSFHDVEIVH